MRDQDTRPREEGPDDDLRALMHEADYTGRAGDRFKRDLQRQLNHNFTYHRVRTRILVAAVVVLGAGAALLQVTDVGSDGFTLKPTGHTVGGGPTVEVPLTGERYNTIPVDGDREEGIARAQDLHEMFAAGDYELLRIETWTLGGETRYHTTYAVEIDGQRQLVMESDGGSNELTRSLWRFWHDRRDSLVQAAERGEVPSAGTQTVRYKDQDLAMQAWYWDTPEFGRVVYRLALP